MRKGFKSTIGLILVLAVIFSSFLAVNSEGLNKVYKKWNFLADSYSASQGFPSSNTWKDLDGKYVWSTWVYANSAITAMKPVSALNGATPAMWSKDGTNTGAPIIQIRPASANMCRVTPAASGTPLLRWTSNISANIKVTSQVMKEAAGGDGTQITLFKNLSQIETVSVLAGDVSVKEITKTVSVNVGDTIEIAIAANANSTSDLSTLNLIIEEIDALTFSVPKLSYTYCGETVDSIVAGGTVSTALEVKNGSAEPIEMIGIAAVYTADNVLCGIGFDKRAVLEAGENTTLVCNVENYTPEGYTGDFNVKMFVLNSLSEMIPIYKGYSYPPTEKRVWDFEKDNVSMGYPSQVPFGDSYGASRVWSYGMGNHNASVANRPYDFRPMIFDAAANIWYNGEEPKMAVPYNFPYIKISKATGESELQTRSRTAEQQIAEGTANARLHPIVRFISPLDGEVEINITLNKKGTGGDGVLLMMGYNGFIYDENASLISIGANAAIKTFTKTISVTKGMNVDFMIHGLANNSDDVSRLGITITEK